MNDLSMFERRLAAGLEAVAGPRRDVDAIAIARTAASRAAVRNSIPSRFSALIGQGVRARGRRSGDLGVGRTAHPLAVFVVISLMTALAIGAIAVGSGLVRMPSVMPPAPSPDRSSAVAPSPSPSPEASRGSGSWILTGRMKITAGPAVDGVDALTATLLANGQVLAVAGSSQLYDPSTGQWTQTGTTHTFHGAGHSATLLPDGKVLVAGGGQLGLGRPPQSAAELYDPATGTWSETGSMLAPRKYHSATVLLDGKVLVAGGSGASNEAELYDPDTGIWTSTGNMSITRRVPSATLLPDGKVLLIDGPSSDATDLHAAELYDPRVGTWAPATSFAGAGGCRIAASLLDGDVLVVCAEPNGVRTSAELYDPGSGTWVTVEAPPAECCVGEAGPLGSIVRLSDGRVLWKDLVDPGELFDPATGTWGSAGGPTYPVDPSWNLPYTVTDEGNGYKADTLTLLPDGRVLMTTLGAALLYDPTGRP
jgi:hypothetical protein